MVGFQSLIATKAARMVEVAGGRAVVDFGTRRAHSPEAGVLAGRASYMGGCIGTSNTETGFRYGVPVFGTAGHSWIQAYPTELEAFRRLQNLLGEATVYLIDTYDTIEGAGLAASLRSPLWGVRLDSGNLVELSRAVRKILDEAGLPDAKIMATSDLNEYKILEFAAADAPIDAFGVGTDLATSTDSPNLGVVYKLVELERPLYREIQRGQAHAARREARSFALPRTITSRVPGSVSAASLDRLRQRRCCDRYCWAASWSSRCPAISAIREYARGIHQTATYCYPQPV